MGETAEDAGEEFVDVTDRAAREGARAQRELESVADRTGNAIHAATEAVVIPTGPGPDVAPAPRPGGRASSLDRGVTIVRDAESHR